MAGAEAEGAVETSTLDLTVDVSGFGAGTKGAGPDGAADGAGAEGAVETTTVDSTLDDSGCGGA